ncbi:hypothetical protein ACH4FX_42985 [Streptomyces sp. NPDC018019]
MNQIPQEPSELDAWWREALGEDVAYWVQPVQVPLWEVHEPGAPPRSS